MRIFFTPRNTPGPTDSSQPHRPRRWRRLFQFSLRSLLILTTLAAVACWWLLQPKMREEKLAGKYLKLRRHVRPVPVAKAAPQPKPTVKATRKPVFGNYSLSSLFNANRDDHAGIDHGTWQIRDEHDDLLVTGRYLDGRTHGSWTIYHPNGRRAATGQMFHGLRLGLWKTWYDDGQRESEVTYAVIRPSASGADVRLPEFNYRPQPSGGPGPCTSVIPVVGAIGLQPLIGGLGFPSFGGMGMGGMPPHLPQYVSFRHGPARTWYRNGQLKSEGNYDHDSRHGHWTFYDDTGHITHSGNYENGFREGPWLIASRSPTPTRSVSEEYSSNWIEFIGGRPRAEHQRLIREIQTDLSSSEIEHQIIAMDRLEELGRHALPLLTKCLEDSSTDLQLLALRRLERMAIAEIREYQPASSIFDAAIMARIGALLDSDNDRVARSAMLLLYRLSPNRREELFPKLLAAIQQFGDDTWKWQALAGLWQTDREHRPAVFAELAQAHNGRLTSPFLTIPLGYFDESQEILDAASRSDDPKMRRYAIEVTAILARTLSKRPFAAGTTTQFAVPEPLQSIVERAKSDSDPAIREAAAAVGIWPDPRWYMGGQSGS